MGGYKAAGGYKVAIIGAGAMGSLLAYRIPAGFRKVIISRERAGAAEIADEVGGLASDQVSAVRGCQVIFLAVPGSAASQFVREMKPHLAENALVVNMAPDLFTGDLAAEHADVRLAAAKVLGHSDELEAGARGVVVLDHVDEEAEERLRQLLELFGPVIRGSETMVQEAGAAVVAVMEEARRNLVDRLTVLGLDKHLARVVLAGAAPGVLRAMAHLDEGTPAKGAIDRSRAGAAPEDWASH
jgi:pyrroline-5-carboxylate reductase